MQFFKKIINFKINNFVYHDSKIWSSKSLQKIFKPRLRKRYVQHTISESTCRARMLKSRCWGKRSVTQLNQHPDKHLWMIKSSKKNSNSVSIFVMTKSKDQTERPLRKMLKLLLSSIRTTLLIMTWASTVTRFSNRTLEKEKSPRKWCLTWWLKSITIVH